MKSKRAQEQIKFVVEKNIPIPRARRARSAVADYAAKLKPSQSFLVKGANATQASQRLQVVRKEFPKRGYTVRTVDGGARIWRTK